MEEEIQPSSYNNGMINNSLQYIEWQKNLIAFRQYGNGNTPLFALHGFDSDSQCFERLAENPPERYRIYAIDLPFHGQTNWQNQTFDATALHAIFGEIYQKDFATQSKKIGILGHSYGGRLALSYYEAYPEQIDLLVLLAPDGLKIPLLYKALFRQKSLQNLFHWICTSDNALYNISTFANKIHLLSASRLQLMQHNFGSKSQSLVSYNRIICSQSFIPNIPIINHLLNTQKTRTYLLMGNKDKLVPSKLAKKLLPIENKNLHIQYFDRGHQIHIYPECIDFLNAAW